MAAVAAIPVPARPVPVLREAPRNAGSLDEAITSVWGQLSRSGSARCPVCRGELRRSGCSGCGSRLG